MNSDAYRLEPCSSRQTTIFGAQKCTERRAKEITEKILAFIVKDMSAVAVVEGGGFRDMIKVLEPGYQVQSRTAT